MTIEGAGKAASFMAARKQKAGGSNKEEGLRAKT